AVAIGQTALAGELAAESATHLDDHLDLSLLLATEATRAAPTLQARGSLLVAKARVPWLIAFLPGHTSGVYSVAFRPNGKTLASGSNDDTIRLWDVSTHRALGPPLSGHPGGVRTVAFSPDGTLLASGGRDGTIRLWDLTTHKQLGRPL